MKEHSRFPLPLLDRKGACLVALATKGYIALHITALHITALHITALHSTARTAHRTKGLCLLCLVLLSLPEAISTAIFELPSSFIRYDTISAFIHYGTIPDRCLVTPPMYSVGRLVRAVSLRLVLRCPSCP
eukprot:scaffold733_cov267-Pinguiococcus_pyrenoidosus.AAC.19